jgi:hypothetical protein
MLRDVHRFRLAARLFPIFSIIMSISSSTLDLSCLEKKTAKSGTRDVEVYIYPENSINGQLVFKEWLASCHPAQKASFSGKKHVQSWVFYQQCAALENGKPGILCLVCGVLLSHPTINGTASMNKHVKSKAHVAKVDAMTADDPASVVSLSADKHALAVLKKKGSNGVLIVSSKLPWHLGDCTN